MAPPREPHRRARAVPPHAAHDRADPAAGARAGRGAGGRRGRDGFLAEALPHLERYYRHRRAADPDDDGLISIVSQFESGLDFSPVYDEAIGVRRVARGALRPHGLPQLRNKLANYDLDTIFRGYPHHLEDVLVNAVYGQGLRALARLARRGGARGDRALGLPGRRRVTAALLERSWDERLGLFVNLAGPDERRSRVKTIHGLMPLVLPDLPGPSPTGSSSTCATRSRSTRPTRCRRSRSTSARSSTTTACAASASSGAGRSR